MQIDWFGDYEYPGIPEVTIYPNISVMHPLKTPQIPSERTQKGITKGYKLDYFNNNVI